MARPSSRESILEAAEEVVIEIGPSRLTLDAVAERAGMSKGGVLYHSPSKEALLTGMIERHIQKYQQQLAAIEEKLKGEPACALRSHLLALLTERDVRHRRVSASLFAVVTNEPEMAKPATEVFREKFRTLACQDGKIDPDRAILFLACDGIKLLEMLGLLVMNEGDRRIVVDRLMQLAIESGAP